MSSSLSLTMSVSDPQNRRLFCGTCRRWGAGGWGRVTLRLEHAKVSCPGSPGTGRDPVFRKGKHCRANSGYFSPPPSWDHSSYKLFLQGCDRTGKTNRRRVRPRRSGSCGDPRRTTPGRTHLAAAGRRTGDSSQGSGGWWRRTARRFVSPSGRRFPLHANQ